MSELLTVLHRNKESFHPLLPFDPQEDKIVKLDFSRDNRDLTPEIFSTTDKFSDYVDGLLQDKKARYGIGGYGEHRAVYGMSKVFDGAHERDEPRRLHLGLDLWGKAGTPVYAPLGGMVHSFAFNDHPGDYGATIILLHQLDGIPFYSLYGHLSLSDLMLTEGSYITRGQEFAHFGDADDNGNWPPHLHLQLIFDIGMHKGDYPGVCRYSERSKYLSNCPDPDLLADLNKFVTN